MEEAGLLRNTHPVKGSGRIPTCIIACLLVMNAFTFLFGQTQALAENGSKASATQPRLSRSTNRDADSLTAKELLHKPVEARTGDRIASVNDLLINTQSGRIVFVVLASGGFAGVGVHLRAVPPGALSLATAKRGVLALDIGPRRWKQAPRMNDERINDLEKPLVAQNIYRFYHQTWLEPTGRIPSLRSDDPAGHLKAASELIGESVIDRRAGEVGHVADLRLALNDTATVRAIVSSSTTDGRRLVVPVNALSADASGNNLLLNADARLMQYFPPVGPTPALSRLNPHESPVMLARLSPCEDDLCLDFVFQLKPQPPASSCKK